jgi:hypothetical protein
LVSLEPAEGEQEAVRVTTNFSSALNARLTVQSSPKKYSRFRFTESMFPSRHPASTRGAYRDRHETRGGEAMAAEEPQRV